MRVHFVFSVITALWISAAHAGEVRNLNGVCQDYLLAKTKSQKKEIRDASGEKNVLYQFRYLQITRVEADKPAKGAMTLLTVEPGTEMEVELIVRHKRSLALAKTVKVGEAVAGKGKITRFDSADSNRIVINPAVIKHKDRLAPVREKELMNEVDPDAH